MGALLGLSGCGIAFGRYRKPDVETFGMGLGLQPGVGHFEIKDPANGEEITKDGRVLHVQMDIRYKLWSLDIGVEYIDLGEDARGAPLVYNAYPDLLLRRRFRMSDRIHLLAGGGIIIGCINGIPLACNIVDSPGTVRAKALRAQIGAQILLGNIMFGPVVLRLEGGAEAGENSVRQQLVTAGLEFWFDVNKDFMR